MLISVKLGYYSGIVAGLFVDKLPNLISFLTAAGVSLIAFGGLAFTIDSDFTLVL